MARSAGSGPGCGRQDVGYNRGSVVIFTHPTLMRLPWFANLYRRWKPWKDRIIAQLKASAS